MCVCVCVCVCVHTCTYVYWSDEGGSEGAEVDDNFVTVNTVF